MRIGLVTGEFPPMQGGVGAFTERLAEATARLGHELHVISHREARPPSGEGGLARLVQLQKPVETAWGWLHPLGRRWGWRDVGEIAQTAVRYDLNIINIQYQAAAYNMRSPALNLAPWRLRGIATVAITFHDLRVPYLFPKAGRLRHYAVRLAARKAHGVIVTNSEDRHTVERWGLEKTRVRQIPIGSNIRVHETEQYEVAAARKALGVDRDTFLLGYFGFLNASKGVDLLVQALSEMKTDVHLVFMGGRTGSSDKENNQRLVAFVEATAREMGISDRLHWTGYIADHTLSKLLQGVDLMVLPYRDGVSLRRGTLMAAMAHGCAIVSSEPKQKISALKHGENIWLTPRDDADALSTAIRQLRDDDTLRARLAAGAKRLARDFSWPSIAARTVDFYESLWSRHGIS